MSHAFEQLFPIYLSTASLSVVSLSAVSLYFCCTKYETGSNTDLFDHRYSVSFPITVRFHRRFSTSHQQVGSDVVQILFEFLEARVRLLDHGIDVRF